MSMVDGFVPFATKEYIVVITQMAIYLPGALGILIVLFVLSRQPLTAGGPVASLCLCVGLAVASLCLADFGLLGIGLVTAIMSLVNGQWNSVALCAIDYMVVELSCFCTLVSLAFLAYERYSIICKSRQLSAQEAVLTIGITWGFGIVVIVSSSFSSNLLFEVQLATSRLNCQIAYFNTKYFWVQLLVTISILTIFVAQSMVQYCYYAIYTRYQETVKEKRAHGKKEPAGSKQMDIKVLKKCGALTITFFACWTPTLVSITYEAIVGGPVSFYTSSVCNLLAGLNSVINPFLLYYFGMRKLLT
ncbi:hypothetical protein HDU91_007466 [Kappamyces sp. JEL0680]|nr:hypothetical protein HDU91_007466 [Kappamyces sp. JEL0680]